MVIHGHTQQIIRLSLSDDNQSSFVSSSSPLRSVTSPTTSVS